MTDEELNWSSNCLSDSGAYPLRVEESAPQKKMKIAAINHLKRKMSRRERDVCNWGVQYKGEVKVSRLLVVERRRSCNKVVFAPMAWSVYLKNRTSGQMERWFGPFPLEEEMPKRVLPLQVPILLYTLSKK